MSVNIQERPTADTSGETRSMWQLEDSRVFIYLINLLVKLCDKKSDVEDK